MRRRVGCFAFALLAVLSIASRAQAQESLVPSAPATEEAASPPAAPATEEAASAPASPAAMEAAPAAPAPAPSEPAPPPIVVSPIAPPVAPPAIPEPPKPDAAPARPAIASPAALRSAPSFRVEAPGGSFIRVGLLLQPQYQAASDLKHASDSYANNLYLRRTRILLGGSLFGQFDFFFDTDYPNLFLANNAVAATDTTPAQLQKNTPGMNIQDAFGTWKILKDFVKVDFGYMLPPLAHNAVQGATTLYSWDYFSYSFRQGNSFNSSASPIGRDLGIQLRGLVADGHLEYRAGLFQGLRYAATTTEAGSRNFFRLAARVQINLLDPEPGFFYQGSYLGAKKILSVGGAVDLQNNVNSDSYRYFAGDAFLDLPVGSIGIVTAQANLMHLDGGTFITTLPKQTALMGEAGFLFTDAANLGAIARAEHLWISGASEHDQTLVGGGIAWWAYGHNSNLKAFYTRTEQEGSSHGANQFNLQWQLYIY